MNLKSQTGMKKNLPITTESPNSQSNSYGHVFPFRLSFTLLAWFKADLSNIWPGGRNQPVQDSLMWTGRACRILSLPPNWAFSWSSPGSPGIARHRAGNHKAWGGLIWAEHYVASFLGACLLPLAGICCLQLLLTSPPASACWAPACIA